MSTSAIAASLPLPAAASQKVSFQQYVNDKLDDIDTRLGVADDQLAHVSDKLDQVLTGLNSCSSTAGDANDIVAVHNTLEEIKKILKLG